MKRKQKIGNDNIRIVKCSQLLYLSREKNLANLHRIEIDYIEQMSKWETGNGPGAGDAVCTHVMK